MSLPQIKLEFNSSTPVQYMTFSLYVGLLVGATVWGIGSDIVGRRLAWLVTLLIGSIFMTAVGGSSSFAVTGVLLALAGVGIGGSLPVDGALLIECESDLFTPFTRAVLTSAPCCSSTRHEAVDPHPSVALLVPGRTAGRTLWMGIDHELSLC